MAEMSTRAKVITRRTYNRPLDDSGKNFETWEQTVDRVIGHQRWLWERQINKSLDSKQTEELAQLKELMMDRKVEMSGRALWMGGTAVSKVRESALFNCLGVETKFITRDGVKSFADFDDGETTQVWTHKGRWRNAVVKNYGKQFLNQISFSKGNSKTEVRATSNHRWILKDNSITDRLSVSDSIIRPISNFNNWSFESSTPQEQLYWCYGFVYGDGSLNGKHSMVRLCGDKGKYIDRFELMGFKTSKPLSCKGDSYAFTGTYQKTLPNTDDSIELLTAFIRGWLDADGAKNSNVHRGKLDNPFKSIQTSGQESTNFVRSVFPTVGLFVSREEIIEKDTNFGKRKAPTIRFGLSSGFGESSNCVYTARDILGGVSYEDVWCLEVEDDHSFTLPNGLVTGNCSFTNVETVFDVVDCLWLLLQGCGVGFKPIKGTLNGFMKPIKNINVIRSTRTEKGGEEFNTETWDETSKVWTIKIGDSAESWAKSIGKLLAGKYPADTLVIDLSNIRPAGERLKGYGWISSGDESIAKAYSSIAKLLSKRAGSLLTSIDILDILNHLGTVLSSRRSAEIALLDANDPEWKEFATAKKDFWLHDNVHRCQSNNSLVFYNKPTKSKLREIFDIMVQAGGSEPGFINGEAALKRAPWFKGCNPCVEILLGNKSFCNLTEVDIGKFHGDSAGLRNAIRLAARANYRQTCVDLRDGILQEAWHLNNEFLRLCGVGLTGIARRGDLGTYDYTELERVATSAAYGMAEEFGTQHPKNITCVKPSGTLSKIMDTTEGVHKPLGKYIFNNVNFSKFDPIVNAMRSGGYKVIPNPTDPSGMLVTFPVVWDDVEFTNVNGVEVNIESAITQLERYKLLQNNWTQQNTSVTISYDPAEIDAIIDWLDENWDLYVGVSFIYRTDPTKTAADLGYLYLPQEVVTKEVFDVYVSNLTEINIDGNNSFEEILDAECAGGVCPVK